MGAGNLDMALELSEKLYLQRVDLLQTGHNLLLEWEVGDLLLNSSMFSHKNIERWNMEKPAELWKDKTLAINFNSLWNKMAGCSNSNHRMVNRRRKIKAAHYHWYYSNVWSIIIWLYYCVPCTPIPLRILNNPSPLITTCKSGRNRPLHSRNCGRRRRSKNLPGSAARRCPSLHGSRPCQFRNLQCSSFYTQLGTWQMSHCEDIQLSQTFGAGCRIKSLRVFSFLLQITVDWQGILRAAGNWQIHLWGTGESYQIVSARPHPTPKANVFREKLEILPWKVLIPKIDSK